MANRWSLTPREATRIRIWNSEIFVEFDFGVLLPAFLNVAENFNLALIPLIAFQTLVRLHFRYGRRRVVMWRDQIDFRRRVSESISSSEVNLAESREYSQNT